MKRYFKSLLFALNGFANEIEIVSVQEHDVNTLDITLKYNNAKNLFLLGFEAGTSAKDKTSLYFGSKPEVTWEKYLS